MTGELELPDRREVEIEYLREGKANERGFLLADPEPGGLGFEVVVVQVAQNLGFQEPFRFDLVRKWLNIAAVAEIRYLAEGSIRTELERLQALHEEVRGRMGRQSP
jgi:hypothetical protein